MFLDKEQRWIRNDKLAPGSEKTGVDGDPRQASAELGKIFLDIKINSAVAQIKSLVNANR
jgi:creatinine amidohydrolase